MRWREHRVAPSNINLETTEGFGVALRLSTPEGALHELWSLFTSDSYWSLLAERFGIDLSQVRRDSGLQKYLDGYEISPHPDIRLKALTFMLNLNPSPRSEEMTFHTHYRPSKTSGDLSSAIGTNTLTPIAAGSRGHGARLCCNNPRTTAS